MEQTKTPKKQADRLLKHLPLRDRKRQQEIRQMIAKDPMFGSLKTAR